FTFEPKISEKKLLAKFFQTLDSIISLGKELKTDIFKSLEIPLYDFSYEDLEKLITVNKHEEALQKAKSVDDDDYIWRLGQFCQNNNKIPQAIEFYQSILKGNPHFEEANETAAHL